MDLLRPFWSNAKGKPLEEVLLAVWPITHQESRTQSGVHSAAEPFVEVNFYDNDILVLGENPETQLARDPIWISQMENGFRSLGKASAALSR